MRIRQTIFSSMVLFVLLLLPYSAKASSSFNTSIDSNSTINAGEDIDITIQINNFEKPIINSTLSLSYDSSKISLKEIYIKNKPTQGTWELTYNESSNGLMMFISEETISYPINSGEITLGLVFNSNANLSGGTSIDLSLSATGCAVENGNYYDVNASGDSLSIAVGSSSSNKIDPDLLPQSFKVYSSKSEYDADEDVTLKWEKSKNADYYSLTVSKYPYGFENAVYNKTSLTGTKVNIGELPPGKYRFNMRGINEYGKSPLTDRVYFEVLNDDGSSYSSDSNDSSSNSNSSSDSDSQSSSSSNSTLDADNSSGTSVDSDSVSEDSQNEDSILEEDENTTEQQGINILDVFNPDETPEPKDTQPSKAPNIQDENPDIQKDNDKNKDKDSKEKSLVVPTIISIVLIAVFGALLYFIIKTRKGM